MAKKFIKDYKSFKGKDFKFEEKVIDPILNCIKDNHDFLTQPENLPQLAKLGYMYNTLWRYGRVCWGYDGILRNKKQRDYKNEDEYYEYTSCEDNPKYKLEMSNPENTGEVDDRVYDSWGMHVSNDIGPSPDEFFEILKGGKPLTELEKKELKINKTFDDWVEIKTDPNYQYKSLYPDRKSVADYLLCTIGNGYGWNKEGFIIEEASGADQDKSSYGDWMNAKFSPEIDKVIVPLINMSEVRETVETAYNYLHKKAKEREDAEKNRWKDLYKKLIDKRLKSKEGVIEDDEVEEEKYRQYYPILSSSKIYAIMSDEKKNRLGIKNFDKSYVDAAIEICKDIMSHRDKERNENVEFAIKLLAKYGFKEYEKELPKEIDKYKLLSEIEDSFLYVTDSMNKVNTHELSDGDYRLYLNDTKDSDYADNNYYFSMSLKGYSLPVGYSNDIEFIKGSDLYKNLKYALNRVRNLDEILFVSLYINNVKNDWNPKPTLEIKMIANKKSVSYEEDNHSNDEYLNEIGFQVGSSAILFKGKEYDFLTKKPDPLGRNHPDNTSGKDYFSQSKPVTIYKGNVKIGEFNVDERGFNTISFDRCRDNNLRNKIIEEFKKMKLSDPGYGLYDIKGTERKYEGKKHLYAHDFIVWLSNNGF